MIKIYQYAIDADSCCFIAGTLSTRKNAKTDKMEDCIKDPTYHPICADKPAPMKLYCVKDQAIGLGFTKGKIYESTKEYVTADDGRIRCLDGYKEYYFGVLMSSFLIPLVSRPAKVGEWIVCVNGKSGYAQMYNNTPIKVEKVDQSKNVWAVFPEMEQHGLEGVFHNEYLVLDGYVPEPEYWSGKVFCDQSDSSFFKQGYVYCASNGVVMCATGKPYGYGVKSVEHLNQKMGKWAHFHEYHGEA